jgi:peptide chain release factor 2
MEQLKAQVQELQAKVFEAMASLKIEELRQTFDNLQTQMQTPDFWQDTKKAAQISQTASKLLTQVEPWEGLQKQLSDTIELINMADTAMRVDLVTQFSILSEKFDNLKKDLRFQGPYDDHDVILSIYAGAGGTDAQDWAQMLLRMYVRWGEDHKLQVKTVDQSPGEEAGIKSATIEITGGSFLYGKLSGENGVHRLVRLSPFNSAASRETSFAKVEVLPIIDKPDEIEIDEKDLKIDVYRAGGRGGQSVNTTDSAVRITHAPTGISVAIQNERSQLQNKDTAMTILRSRLAALQLEQHAETLADVKGPNQSAEFGNQIRNYVLHPYKQVKDTRTGYESSDVEKVLGGQLDPLLDAWLESH